ncbi:MAG: hypothetical protein KJ799_02140 [Bacteroidetes bacterium]|nr:hypothetical protein [Bacteroidota bacterium]MBU1677773.1 hypothetical protein [Bacteroidota bacterium]MBU2505510.1 hypothetical protein [Bacteroidota bacterium]
MKKKNLTINEIEGRIKKMGRVEISDKEFSSADEYKKLHDYVKRIFGKPKKDIAQKRRQHL